MKEFRKKVNEKRMRRVRMAMSKRERERGERQS